MSAPDLIALLPLLIVAATTLAAMLLIAFYRHHQATAGVTVAGLLLALASLSLTTPHIPRVVTPLLVVDGYALFFLGLVLATTAVVTALSYRYLEPAAENVEEYYLLLLMGALGGGVLISARHFVSFFLGLELLSVSLYTLVAYTRSQSHRIEAGLKYLILAGTASAFLLFGLALVYAEQGHLVFEDVVLSDPSLFLLSGMGLLIVGVAFKLALAPFHLWTPDVYQGAPAPVTAFVATVSKGAVFALLFRFFGGVRIAEQPALLAAFGAIAILSMLAGNLLALVQDNVKRILAYSSIAHLGYLTIAFLVGGELGQTAAAFYLAIYFVTTLTAFGVVTWLSTAEEEAEALDDYRGLFRRSPHLAGIFTVALLSLAGIPPTAGLISKVYVALAGVSVSLWAPLLVLVAGSVAGVFYYMRIVITMWRDPAGDEQAVSFSAGHAPAGYLILNGLTLALLALGVYPFFLIQIIERALGAGG
ncbi:MAG: NADH-quinone oxidoreductase subunit N [Candidatus Promineifilaceae bacterium]|nr:NADH-quinone oxidoreductase subunit N [Candidatus Promineifilaceae bacterium]